MPERIKSPKDTSIFILSSVVETETKKKLNHLRGKCTQFESLGRWSRVNIENASCIMIPETCIFGSRFRIVFHIHMHTYLQSLLSPRRRATLTAAWGAGEVGAPFQWQASRLWPRDPQCWQFLWICSLAGGGVEGGGRSGTRDWSEPPQKWNREWGQHSNDTDKYWH